MAIASGNRLAVIAILASIAYLQTTAMFGQEPNAATIQQLAPRVPVSERFVFSRQLLGGVLLDLDPERADDAEILNKAADSWTEWVCASKKPVANSEEWIAFVTSVNQSTVRRYGNPALVNDGNYPRLTAMVLPINLDSKNNLEREFTYWSANRESVESWGEVRRLLGNIPGDNSAAGKSGEFARHVNEFYVNPGPRKWNELVCYGTEFKWDRASFDDFQQKSQIDRGVQRVLMNLDWNNPEEQSKASKLGRDYWRCEVANDRTLWEKFTGYLGSLAAEKRFETVVTFVSRNSKEVTKDATFAYRYMTQPKPDRTIKSTVKINSGVYEVWSERKEKPTSDKLVHRIFSNAFEVPILERDDVAP